MALYKTLLNARVYIIIAEYDRDILFHKHELWKICLAEQQQKRWNAVPSNVVHTVLLQCVLHFVVQVLKNTE